MNRLLRRRSNTSTGAVVSPPPSAPPKSKGPSKVRTPEEEAQQVRLEVYLSHWQQIQAIVNKVLNNNRIRSKVSSDEVQTVANYALQMIHLLVEEEPPAQGTMGRLLEILIQENVMERLYLWSERTGDYQESAKQELLKLYEQVLSRCRQPVLMHPAILNPLLRILLACWEYASEDTQTHLIPLLQALCISLSRDPNLLEFLFHASPSKGPAKFLLFSLLIPYIHQDGLMGQQARDALLLCISVSAEAKHIGKYIVESTNLCPVLAGGLGALYSGLPGRLDITPDHWHRLTHEDVANIPELAMFLNSLEFCNAVVQVAHPLISEQLVQYFHDGFLVPVIGPALHQFSFSDLFQGTTDLNLNEEIVSATAYVELFLRSISDPRLMRAFLRYLCLGWYDNTTIMESLIRRIGTNTKLCMVTLSLFNTLLEINCEDVIVELILKYLVPSTHVMASQRKAIRDLDFYGKWAEKFLSLSPECSRSRKEQDGKGGHRGSRSDLSSRGRNASDIPESHGNGIMDSVRLTSKDTVVITGSNQSLNNGVSDSDVHQNGHGRLTLDVSLASNSSNTSVHNSDSDTLSQVSRLSSEGSVCEIESSHIEYLTDARNAIVECSKSCKHWSSPYDGFSPGPSVLSPDVENAGSSTERFGFDGSQRNSISTPRRESNLDECANDRTLDGNSNAPNEHPLSRSHDSSRSLDSSRDSALAGTLSSTIEEVLNMSIGGDGGKDNKGAADVSLEEIFQGEKLSADLISRVEELQKDDADTELSEDREDSSQGDSEVSSSRHSSKKRVPFPGFDRSVMSDDSQMSSSSHSRHNSAFEFDEPAVFWQFDSEIEATMDQPRRMLSSTVSSGGYFYDESFEGLQGMGNGGHDGITNGGALHVLPHTQNGFLDSGEFSLNTNGTSDLASPLSFDGLDMDDSHFTLSDEELSSNPSSRDSSPRRDGKSSSPIKGSGSRANSGNLPRPAGLTLQSMGSPSPSSFSPIGKISGTPTIGPFMMTIFTKLDSMMENSLYVNLLLTGIVSRLACYPQPLLRSFLLNTNMVFQPSVRSLLQVLTSVKSRLDVYAKTVDKWDVLLHRAKQYLASRESPEAHSRDRSWTAMEDRDRVTVKARSGTLTSIKQQVSRRTSLSDIFLRRRNRSVQSTEKQKLAAIRESGVGAAGLDGALTSPEYESLKSRNAVYCAVVLDEFTKELAALAQEHAVLGVEDL